MKNETHAEKMLRKKTERSQRVGVLAHVPQHRIDGFSLHWRLQRAKNGVGPKPLNKGIAA